MAITYLFSVDVTIADDGTKNELTRDVTFKVASTYMPGLNVFAEYEYEKDYGAFRRLQRNAGESTSQNTLTFGLGLIF